MELGQFLEFGRDIRTWCRTLGLGRALLPCLFNRCLLLSLRLPGHPARDLAVGPTRRFPCGGGIFEKR
jgi:hypothetical protein